MKMVTDMKILVFSDSHGYLGHMMEAVEKENPDHIFFLGDHYRDALELAEIYPDIPVTAVRGNCDWGSGPEEEEVMLSGVRFLLTHGHRYGCKAGYGGLISEGCRRGVDVVCFGHTHQALHVQADEKLWLFNPGTAGGIHNREGYGVLFAEHGKVNGRLL